MKWLPTSLEVNGTEYPIRSDYRPCLEIFEAMADQELSTEEKWLVALQILYEDDIPPEHYEEAIMQALWFLNGGDEPQGTSHEKPIYDWEQDEQMIFSAVNKVAGKEIRIEPYIHYWTFKGYFNEIGEGLFTSVVNIRRKNRKKKRLDKAEQEFYRNNKALIDLKKKYSKKDMEIMNSLNELI